jgi:hypothetical protein
MKRLALRWEAGTEFGSEFRPYNDFSPTSGRNLGVVQIYYEWKGNVPELVLIHLLQAISPPNGRNRKKIIPFLLRGQARERGCRRIGRGHGYSFLWTL